MASQEDVQNMAQDYNQLQQQLQMVLIQRQQLSMQEKELDQALEEVKSSPGPFYRFVGSVLVARGKDQLESELAKEKQDVASKNVLFEKQEKKIMERFTEVRKKLESYAQSQRGTPRGAN
ncbi:prefoldin subunit [Candidatus Micrarchaeota archaeon]|nr:prefoldin subunit [Candidatus Micrarchaeota archaeon]